MKYYLFLDETGDHGLTYIDRNFPLFLLCGLIIEQKALIQLEDEVNSFKEKFFGTKDVILHSRDIRKCEGPFQILFDLSLKEQFYANLNKILSDAQYSLVGSAVNKKRHIKKYGKIASDLYSLSLSFVLERLVFYLDSISVNAKAHIYAEERGKKENNQLVKYFNSVRDMGTYYVTNTRLQNRIEDFRFFNKRDNIVGLQIADLCAYPMARHVLTPSEPYVPFKIIRDKIYCNNKGDYLGWGLKVFP